MQALQAAAGTLAASNYDFPNLVNSTLTVGKAHLTLTAGPKSKLYGDAVPALTATLSGFVLGENAATAGVTSTANLSTTATTTSPVGFYGITVSAGTLAASNYDFPNLVNGTITVGRAHLTLTADPKSKLYGDAVPGPTYSIMGFVLGETAATAGVTGTASLSSSATAASPVGSYSISVAPGTLAAANYDFPTLVNGTLIISPAHLTIIADAKSKLYGDAVPALTATVSGFVLGENAATAGVTGTAGLSTTTTASSPVGSYPITAAAGTLAASNPTRRMPV